MSESREQALAKRALKGIESGKRELQPLEVGDSVQLQNQTGNKPGKWYCTGTIAGVLPHRQYQVILDGSRRVSLRNRRFLRKILPISRVSVDSIPEPSSKPSASVCPPQEIDCIADNNALDTLSDRHVLHPVAHPADADIVPGGDVDAGEGVSVAVSPAKLRRGGRVRTQRRLFSAKMTGKYHGESLVIEG